MSDRTPLLVQFPHSGHLGLSRYRRARRAAQKALSSKAKHWFILALIILDIAGILTDIFIALITCELGREGEPWVRPIRDGLTSLSLVLSCLFLVELILSLWAVGPSYDRTYLSSKVTCFDAFVIVVGFVIDIVEHGDVVEEIASLVVILRLWRFVKIVDEFTLEASEQWDEVRERLEALEKENSELKEELRRYKQASDGGEASV
ncbi:hypothetical protein TruAng_008973 [Truncatella angustata]|nr:hypothetical protein TruAng_008973 [Truncatella angustata]